MATKKNRRKRSGQRSRPKSEFRNQVEADVVDRLLHRFVALVKHGLELMLHDPSELARKEFRQNPDLVYTAEEVPILVLWAAVGAYELSWLAFCQQILTHPAWAELLGVETQADLDRLAVGLEQCPVRVIELAVHDGLKEGDKQDRRPVEQRPPVREEHAQYIGITLVLKLLKKRLRPFLKRLDQCDPKRPHHRPRTYRTRSFVLADLARWMLGLQSTDELIRELAQHPGLAGAVNFRPGAIPSKATFSRRRMAVPLADLRAILHELVAVLVRCRVIDGRAWVVDLTRVPTYSSVSKPYPDRLNGKSDPEAAFCGYPDNDGGFQFGYCLVWIVDFKTELPIALVFGAGNAQDSPLAQPLLEQACAEHPHLARRCEYFIGDGGYDTLAIFDFILTRLKALPAITKNPRNAADPEADLATDARCILRRRSPLYMALFHSRTSVERTNSWAKLTFNLKYHKQRGWNAVEHGVLLAAIAMLSVAWVAVKTGHPDQIRSARTWISRH
ncbi:MAG: transposase [Chloroflexi bacterium]|nr:transposase [Chloroflexota bacterium]MBU1747449.1 transposase [Chloroflexota bacterium]